MSTSERKRGWSTLERKRSWSTLEVRVRVIQMGEDWSSSEGVGVPQRVWGMSVIQSDRRGGWGLELLKGGGEEGWG